MECQYVPNQTFYSLPKATVTIVANLFLLNLLSCCVKKKELKIYSIVRSGVIADTCALLIEIFLNLHCQYENFLNLKINAKFFQELVLLCKITLPLACLASGVALISACVSIQAASIPQCDLGKSHKSNQNNCSNKLKSAKNSHKSSQNMKKRKNRKASQRKSVTNPKTRTNNFQHEISSESLTTNNTFRTTNTGGEIGFYSNGMAGSNKANPPQDFGPDRSSLPNSNRSWNYGKLSKRRKIGSQKNISHNEKLLENSRKKTLKSKILHNLTNKQDYTFNKHFNENQCQSFWYRFKTFMIEKVANNIRHMIKNNLQKFCNNKIVKQITKITVTQTVLAWTMSILWTHFVWVIEQFCDDKIRSLENYYRVVLKT